MCVEAPPFGSLLLKDIKGTDCLHSFSWCEAWTFPLHSPHDMQSCSVKLPSYRDIKIRSQRYWYKEPVLLEYNLRFSLNVGSERAIPASLISVLKTCTNICIASVVHYTSHINHILIDISFPLPTSGGCMIVCRAYLTPDCLRKGIGGIDRNHRKCREERERGREGEGEHDWKST